jgi:hypothetical protein
MKKLVTVIIVMFFFCSLSNAQDTLYMYKSGEVVSKRAVTDIDSIIFYDATQSGGQVSSTRNYFGAGSYSDIITYEIDGQNKRYSFKNETTGMHNSGSYTLSTNENITGVYEITESGNIYPAIETPGKYFATTYSSGNSSNRLVLGITSKMNLSADYTTNDLAGKYLWANYDNLDEFGWGGIEVLANGTFTWQIGPEGDADFSENVHFSGDGSGTWEISQVDPSRIIFRALGNEYNGTIYPGKALIMENGSGYGFTLGVKYPANAVSQVSISGKYTWIGYTPEGYRGVGSFVLPASGTTGSFYSFYYNNPYFSSGTQTMSNYKRSSTIKNTFTGELLLEGELFYTSIIALPGEMLIMVTFSEDSGIVGLAVAFKVNE